MSMDINQREFNNQIEIADLIAESVQNASARRNQVLEAKESLLAFSEEEAKGIIGGQVGKLDPIICGMFPCDPPFLS